MKNHCVFKEINSLDLGLYMERCPERISPKRRDETITIPGRQGVLVTTDGTYESYIKQAEFIVRDTSRLDAICSHFKGSGWLTFSNEPDRRYKARVSNTITLAHVIGKIKRFPVEFEVQPFAYERNPKIISKSDPFGIVNPGTFESEPIITLHASGDVSLLINGKTITLSDITETVTIDSETMNVYSGSVSMNNNMAGDFPIFNVGNNSIFWTGNVAKVEVQPNWRWL